MILLVISIATLWVGTIMYPWARRTPALEVGVRAFVLASVLGLVLTHLLPETIEELDTAGLVAMAIGVAAGRFLPASSGGLAAGALALHAVLDGAALRVPDGTNTLAAAVVIHRLPVGFVIAQMLSSDRRKMLTAVVLISLATVLGYAASTPLLEQLPVSAMGWVKGFLAGMLLHVALEWTEVRTDKQRVSSWVGIAGGLVATFLLASLHDDHHHGGNVVWTGIALSAPLALVIAAVRRSRADLSALVPGGVLAWLIYPIASHQSPVIGGVVACGIALLMGAPALARLPAAFALATISPWAGAALANASKKTLPLALLFLAGAVFFPTGGLGIDLPSVWGILALGVGLLAGLNSDPWTVLLGTREQDLNRVS